MKIINSIVHQIKNMGRSLVVSNNEPQIEEKSDRYGNLYWQVYDRTTHKSHTFGSDLEVRAWIEERYHRV